MTTSPKYTVQLNTHPTKNEVKIVTINSAELKVEYSIHLQSKNSVIEFLKRNKQLGTVIDKEKDLNRKFNMIVDFAKKEKTNFNSLIADSIEVISSGLQVNNGFKSSSYEAIVSAINGILGTKNPSDVAKNNSVTNFMRPISNLTDNVEELFEPMLEREINVASGTACFEEIGDVTDLYVAATKGITVKVDRLAITLGQHLRTSFVGGYVNSDASMQMVKNLSIDPNQFVGALSADQITLLKKHNLVNDQLLIRLSKKYQLSKQSELEEFVFRKNVENSLASKYTASQISEKPLVFLKMNATITDVEFLNDAEF